MSSRRSAILSFFAVSSRKVFTPEIVQALTPDGEAANASYAVFTLACASVLPSTSYFYSTISTQ